MRSQSRRTGILLPLLLLTLATGCTRIEDSREEDLPPGPMAQESWDVTLQISEVGVIRLELDAARMRRYEDPDSVFTIFEKGEDSGDRVRVSFYDSLGMASGSLSAEYVRFDENSKRMIAAGDVVLESEAGRKLESENLIWDENARSIEAPGFVSLTTETQNIRGYEFRASEDLSTWELQRPTGRVQVPEQ